MPENYVTCKTIKCVFGVIQISQHSRKRWYNGIDEIQNYQFDDG
jgi:hypothetical protein